MITFTCDLQIDLIMFEPPYVNFLFMNLIHSPAVYPFDILQKKITIHLKDDCWDTWMIVTLPAVIKNLNLLHSQAAGAQTLWV